MPWSLFDVRVGLCSFYDRNRRIGGGERRRLGEEAAGILGLRAERPEQVEQMLNQALEHNGPALVDIVVNRQELLIPPTINLDQIRGFTLYMIKAVLNGRGDEVVDLAKDKSV